MDLIYVREGDGLFLDTINLVFFARCSRSQFMVQCGDGIHFQRCICTLRSSSCGVCHH